MTLEKKDLTLAFVPILLEVIWLLIALDTTG